MSSQPFSLLGLVGLLLPGAAERPCFMAYSSFGLEIIERNKEWHILIGQAAIAACWWAQECNAASGMINQPLLWQRVYEIASERHFKKGNEMELKEQKAGEHDQLMRHYIDSPERSDACKKIGNVFRSFEHGIITNLEANYLIQQIVERVIENRTK